jgi:hypothetical protein
LANCRTSSAAAVGHDGAPACAFNPAPVPSVADDIALVHTGSIAAALVPDAARVRAGFAAAKAAGALVAFDPNVRPGLLADPAARARILDLPTLSDAVKLSDEDAARLFPGRSVDEVLDAALDRGATLVAVTTGAAGSTLATTAHRVRRRHDRRRRPVHGSAHRMPLPRAASAPVLWQPDEGMDRGGLPTRFRRVRGNGWPRRGRPPVARRTARIRSVGCSSSSI